MISASLIAEAERHLARTDPLLAKLIQHHGPCTIGRRRRDPFQVLASAIIGQQLSTKAADTIQARVLKSLGVQKKLTPAHFTDVEVAQLRACGLSNAKARWLLTLAAATASGTLDFRAIRRMDDAAAMQVLDDLPGVGQWTAEMMLIFAFDRLDVFSMGDVGLRRSMDLLYNRGRTLSDARTLRLTRPWAPYRSVASWYLWRVADGDNTSWA